MSRQYRFNILFLIFSLGILLFNQGKWDVLAAPKPIATATSTVAVTSTLAATPTPSVENGVEPQALLDGSIDVEHFAPNGAIVVHFNTQMDKISLTPLLSWPAVDGQSIWDDIGSTLTFKPIQRLSNNAAYTFFLNPTLHSKEGKSLEKPPEWQIQTQLGPKIVGVSPQAGDLNCRFKEIDITFDQEMEPVIDDNFVSIEPAIPFKLSWKTTHILQIELDDPFSFNQEYRLSVRNGLPAANGGFLESEYDWNYKQLQPQAQLKFKNPTEIRVEFNYPLSWIKTGLGFSISPALEGEWNYVSRQELVFKSSAPIPANQLYTISYPSQLADVNDFEITGLEKLQFSGEQPIRLLADTGWTDRKYKISENTYGNETSYYAGYDTKSIQLEFLVPVDHVSVEKAFSLTPLTPGTIAWETSDQGHDVLVYRLSQQMESSTNYTIQLSTNIHSASGQPIIAKPFVKTIWVDEYKTGPCFGDLGNNIQVLDAEGARHLEYAPGREEASFSVYRLDLIDFINIYPPLRSRSSTGIKIPIPAGNKPAATWSKSTTRDVGEGHTVTETTLPSSLEPGLYVINAYGGEKLYDQMFVVLTRNTLVVKDNGRKLTAWVTNINGKAVEKAEIRVYNAKGQKIREGQSDENGLYSVDVPDGETAILVSARVREPHIPDDITITALDLDTIPGNDNGWFSSWFTSWKSDNSSLHYDEVGYDLPQGGPLLTYAYTDRPVYRPGQTVNFKVILRQDNDMRYSLPTAGTPVTVHMQDGRGNTLDTLSLATNNFGSVNGDFLIPDGAMLGKYSIETEINGLRDYQYFRVEDYRKPDYQVTITSLQPEKQNRYVRGEDVKIQVHAAYYFGEPLAGATLKVDTFREFSVSSTVSGETITDTQGNASLTIKAPYDDSGSYRWWDSGKQQIRLQVSADDGSHQSVTGQYYFDVYPSTDQINIDTGGYYAQPGQTINVKISDKDIFDHPIAGRELTLSVLDWNYAKFEFETTSQNMPIKTDTDGNASLQVTLKTGYHQLSLAGKDALGNTIEKEHWAYVFKDKTDWIQRGGSIQLAISTERDTYKPYEKARLAIESSFSGPAWLTFERGSIINSKQIELTAPLTIVETDIIPEHAPNVFITVNAWQPASTVDPRYNYVEGTGSSADSYMRIARTHIYVDASSKALDIEIKLEKQIYAPGETVNTIIQVKDAKGQPVLAELSLAVVDESIFALVKDNVPPIFDAFYSPRGLSLRTYDSMVPWRYIYSPEFGGGGGETPPEPRDNFQDTSTWLPVIETDTNGQASVQFKLPDNTTRWRLSVKAVTRQNQVGQSQAYLETKKELFLRPSLPRILTQGDIATLTAFVHNYSDAEQNVQVSLNAMELELLTDAEQRVTLQPGQVLQVSWQVRVAGSVPTQVTIQAKASENLQDSVQLPLNIQPATVREVQTQSGQVEGTLNLALNLPQIDQKNSRLTLTLNRSLGGTLLNGLEFLTGYPYGCVEQTMSRALPNAVVAHAENELGLGSVGLQSRLPVLIQASLAKLYSLQHSDGGWGWWYDDSTDIYQTAWVLFGLSVIQDSGYTVEPQVIQEAVDSLKNEMRESNNLDPRLQAYVLYSLARAKFGERDATLKLAHENSERLDPFSQAALALALYRIDEKQKAHDLLDLLSKNAVKESEFVYWPQASPDGQYHNKTMSSSLRTTALALQAYVEIDPQNTLIPGIVHYLLSKRKGIEGWGTTNETSYTILALTEYLKAQNQNQEATSYQVSINGKSFAKGTLDVGRVSTNLEIPLTQLANGANGLTIETQGNAPLYFDLSAQYYRLQAPAQAGGSIKISRRYLDPNSGAVIDQPQAGQLVKVELTVDTPEDISYLALEDYLPGGFEALNEGLNASMNPDTPDDEYDAFLWDDYGYNYKEIRGDRVVFFVTKMEKGTHTVTYLARATIPGKFTALPTQAYAMYDMQLWGRSALEKIAIK